MLRHAAAVAASRASCSSFRLLRSSTSQYRAERCLVTAAQKRALNKSQLAGEKSGAEASQAAAAEGVTSTSSATTSTPGGAAPVSKAVASGGVGSTGGAAGGTGGGGTLVPLLAVAAVGAGGAAYYFDVIPGMGGGGDDAKEKEAKRADVPVVEKEEEASAEPAVETTTKQEEEGETNRVTTISFPPIDEDNRPPQVVPPVEHLPDANRVSVEQLNSEFYDVVAKKPVAEAAKEEEVEEKKPSEEIIEVEPAVLASTEEAEAELKSTETAPEEDATSVELRAAHMALRANLDEGLLKDLDTLNERELRIRVVQLASEMAERTKWEAVRLKEFLAMKEKETANKYLEVLQKQRLEFEDLLARRLREQEDALTRQANASLQAKEDAIQSVISAAAEAQQAEHQAELQSTSERMDREYNAKYETEYGSKLAESKAQYGKELEEKVAVIEELTAKLRQLESVLEVSRTFESGSQSVHKMSAAALALAEKMETSLGAAVELAALQAAAGDDGVIASALLTIPPAIKTGVPTLSELQAKFDKVHSVSRQAAMVPEGRTGLDGQVLGMIFSKITIPPSPDSVPPSAEDGTPADTTADYVLSRAYRHVQLGDLERAVEQLDKLSGQAAFTVKDWKRDAKDRIMVEKALKVIKMECALMNKNMSGGTES